MVFMLHGQRWHMDKADIEERLAKAAPAFSRAAPLIVGVFSILTLVLAGNLYVSPPAFQTDLNDFSPETEASEAHDRIHDHFPNEMRPLFIAAGRRLQRPALDAMKAMQDDAHFQDEAAKRENMVSVWTTPWILQLALDEEGGGAALASFEDWSGVIDALFDDNETCGLTADDQLPRQPLTPPPPCCTTTSTTSPCAFTLTMVRARQHQPLPRRCGCWRSTPTSTKRHDGCSKTNCVTFSERSSTSALTYEVISNDLLAHDIDEGTFDNLLLLVLLAFVVMLSVAFRSLSSVAFPLVGLTSALIWTYGILNISGARFTALGPPWRPSCWASALTMPSTCSVLNARSGTHRG